MPHPRARFFLIVRMVRYEPTILGISHARVGNYVRVSIDSQDATVEGDHLLRAVVIEVEHVIDLTLEEQSRRTLWFQLEAEPEERPFPCAVSVAANKVRIATKGMRGPGRKLTARVVEPIELSPQAPAYSNLTAGRVSQMKLFQQEKSRVPSGFLRRGPPCVPAAASGRSLGAVDGDAASPIGSLPQGNSFCIEFQRHPCGRMSDLRQS
ncbi:hypothetical protein SAMN05421819_2465 [Bryocella elongata]|uniref:Uncharacterized protein n=1 Tax=Bryocella elongata TaxID=863522 RepID=A0A1H5Z7D8_9BACT|nr:hypothetical protein SAMN05421819_2465 [Bryocella elongata]